MLMKSQGESINIDESRILLMQQNVTRTKNGEKMIIIKSQTSTKRCLDIECKEPRKVRWSGRKEKNKQEGDEKQDNRSLREQFEVRQSEVWKEGTRHLHVVRYLPLGH